MASLDGELVISESPNLIKCPTPLTSYFSIFMSLSLDQVSLPLYPNTNRISLSQFSWVKHIPEFEGKTVEEFLQPITIAGVHLIGGSFPYDDSGMPFEFYNPVLFTFQLGFYQEVSPSTFQYPVCLSHLASEIETGKFSKATVELRASVPLHNPVS